LFFFEQWADREALDAHFAVPASGAFVNAASKLAVDSPTLEIFDVS
jgi:quinol monooxygenase YgiN